MAQQIEPTSSVTFTNTDSTHLRILYNVNDLLRQAEVDSLDMNVVLSRILQLAQNELQAQTGSIFVLDANQDLQHVWLVDGETQMDDVPPTPFLRQVLNEGIAGQAIRDQQIVVIDDSLTDDRWLLRDDHVTTRESWSAICAPFVIRNRVVGTITLTKPGLAEFGPAAVNLLDAIASQTASTIENARLYQEAQRQIKIQSMLNEASTIINSSLDLNEILQSLLSQMNQLLDVEALSIALVDEDTNELVYVVGEGSGSEAIVGLRLPANEGVSGWVMQQVKPALVPDTRLDPRFTRKGDERTSYPTKSIICAPLHVRGQVLGTVQAINARKATFTKDDLSLMVSLANLASSAIHHAQQFSLIQAAEARYTALFDDSIDPIVLTNLEGTILGINQQALRFFGYETAELLNKSLHLLHPTVTENQTYRLQVTSPSDVSRIVTSQVLTKDGKLCPIEVHGKLTVANDTEILQWIYHDISEQVELESMRQDLTAMLVHDLQSPLSNVISSLQLLEEDLPDNSGPTVLMLIDIALKSSARLQDLINSLLEIQRLESGKLVINAKPTDVHMLVDEARRIVLPNMEKYKMDFVANVPTELEFVAIDAAMIQRVLVNLLDNAIKFNPHGQTITVDVVPIGEDKRVKISISDQGEGIPPEFRSVVFDKFRRVRNKSKAKGLGLGLAFCRLAVEAHKGQIWVDEADGGGARFNFTVPIG
ncbi:MAG TPA: GAF domain-containing protein [Anaerolineae bacterium]|nr:GAF domain-containing protein [Anaerolineae bacterium]